MEVKSIRNRIMLITFILFLSFKFSLNQETIQESQESQESSNQNNDIVQDDSEKYLNEYMKFINKTQEDLKNKFSLFDHINNVQSKYFNNIR